MPRTATAERVDRESLLAVPRPRHRAVLLTHRHGGGVQLSPVTRGVDGEGRIVVASASPSRRGGRWGPADFPPVASASSEPCVDS